MNRRRFIAGLGAAAAAVALAEIAGACAGDSPNVAGPGPTGALNGTVVDANGTAQGIGRIYLLQKNGFNSGTYADVDSAGRFDFGSLPVGDYLVRFWGGNLAEVPEPLHNPVRITVTAGAVASVHFQIIVSPTGDSEREIYVGDFFFQEQPAGAANGTTVVRLGTLVCWYNVGQVPHTVTGGPWGDSGPIGIDGNFMWTTDRVGTFPYRCTYHGTQMIAALQVVLE